jgi:hypothetical protein
MWDALIHQLLASVLWFADFWSLLAILMHPGGCRSGGSGAEAAYRYLSSSTVVNWIRRCRGRVMR